MNIFDLDTKRTGEIWAIGGGKGGSGKTFITSNMGTYLANKGKKVILIDADFGGANLHSFIGVNRPQYSLTDFFGSQVPLEDIITASPIENLGLVVGDIHSLSPDNIQINQKIDLYKNIVKLNAEYILIDIGAGSHRDTIDTFLLANRLIVVFEPNVISIENMYQFTRNALYRKLKWTLRPLMTEDIYQYFRGKDRKDGSPIRNIKELLGYLQDIPELKESIEKVMDLFQIHLILNKMRTTQDIELGSTVKSFLIKYLGINAKYVGFIEYEDSVWKSARKRQVLLRTNPSSRSSKEIRTSAENILLGSELRFV